MIRGALNSLLLVLLTLLCSVAAIVSGIFDRSGNGGLKVAWIWAFLLVKLGGLKVTVQGGKDLDLARPYVFMANHLSMVDIWVLLFALPVPVRMITKRQLGSIPFLGWALRSVRFIFIDRQNPLAARRSIKEAVRRIKTGESVLLFPEGTRSRDGVLGPFKKGGFHLAIEAGAPVVPIAMLGPREAMPRGSALLRTGTVRVKIGRPIPTADGNPNGDGQRETLVNAVRRAITTMQDQLLGGGGDDSGGGNPSAQ